MAEPAKRVQFFEDFHPSCYSGSYQVQFETVCTPSGSLKGTHSGCYKLRQGDLVIRVNLSNDHGIRTEIYGIQNVEGGKAEALQLYDLRGNPKSIIPEQLFKVWRKVYACLESDLY